MGLEAVTYIDDLVVTNPADVDDVEEGDDHLRNIKLAVRNAISASATDTQLKHGSGGTSTLKTTAAGIQVVDPSTFEPAITLNDGSGDVVKLHESGGNAYLDGLTHGGDVRLRAEDLAGTMRDILVGDPDGDVTIYRAGTARLKVTDTGGAGMVEIEGGTDKSPDANGDGFLKLDGNNYNGYITLDATGMYIGHNSGSRTIVFKHNLVDQFEITATEVAMHYQGLPALVTSSQGASFKRTTGSTTTAYWRDASNNIEGHLNTRGSASFQLKAYNPGRGFDAIGRNAGDTADNTLISSDPDAGVELFYQGKKAFDTTGEGIDVLDTSGNVPRINLKNDANANQARVYASSGLYLQCQTPGHAVWLVGRNSGDTADNNILKADPDGPVDIYHGGNLRMYTTGNGVEVRPDGAGNKFLMLANSSGNDQLAIYHTDTDAILRNYVNGGEFRIQADTSAGSTKTGFEFDPDGGGSDGAVGFNNKAPYQPNYTLTGTFISRSLSTSSGTGTVRSVLGTVISDLITMGLFR